MFLLWFVFDYQMRIPLKGKTIRFVHCITIRSGLKLDSSLLSSFHTINFLIVILCEHLPPSLHVMPLMWLRLSNISSVVELVDFPLPNQPVERSKLTARLLFFANRLSSLFCVFFVRWIFGSLIAPLPDTLSGGFARSRRHRKRPNMRSIKFDVVNETNSSLLLLLLWPLWFAHTSISPTRLISLSLLLSLISKLAFSSDLSQMLLFSFGDTSWWCSVFAPILWHWGISDGCFCIDKLWMPPLLLPLSLLPLLM